MPFIFKIFLPYCKILVHFFLPPPDCELLETWFLRQSHSTLNMGDIKRILVDYLNDDGENNEIKAVIYYSTWSVNHHQQKGCWLKPTFFFFFFNNFFFPLLYLFIYLFLAVLGPRFVRGLSPAAASGGHPSSRCAGPSLSRPLPLRGTGSRRAGPAAVAHGPSRSAACGILPDQGSNPRPLH